MPMINPVPEDFTMSEMPIEGAAHTPAGPSPDLTYAELVELFQMADQTGDVETAMQVQQAIENRDYIETQSDLVSAGMGFSQGATLGFGDELAAAIRAGTEQFIDPYMFAIDQKMRGLIGAEQADVWKDMSFGELVRYREEQFWNDKDYMQRYREALQSGRNMLETARREDPYATFGGEIAGAGMLTAAPAAGIVRGATGIPSAALRLGGMGTVEGGLTGYGHSEAAPIQAMAEDRTGDEVSREVQRAAFDAGIMASIGGGMSVTMPLAGPLARKVGQMFTAPFTKNARLKEVGRREIAEAIKKDLAERNITLAQAQQELRDTPGMTAADLGQFTRELTETMAQRPTEGAAQLREFLQGRNIDQWQRMHPRLAEALTGKAEDNFGIAYRELMSDMKSKAAQAYDSAYGVQVRLTPAQRAILKNPQMAPALKYANEIREAAGKKPLKLKKLRANQFMSTKEMDEIIRGMDTLVSKRYGKGRGTLGGMLKDLRDDFREDIYVQNPAFRDARQTWANDKLNEEAMDKGLRLFNDDADIVGDVVREMSPAEREYFKIGALRAITRKLGNKVDTADMSKGLWNQPNAREALRVAFGSKDKFDEFMEYVAKEQRMYQTYHQAVGNSQTARRLAQMEVAQGGGLAYAMGYLGAQQLAPNLPMGLAGALSRRGYEEIANPSPAQIAAMQQQSREMANMMMSRDLQNIMRPQTLGGLLDTGIPLAPTVGTTGLIGTAGPNPAVDTGM